MDRRRILIVDDSVVFRVVLSRILQGEPDMEVVGVAANGLICLEKIAQLRPDLVVLDIEMPEMNGLEALVEIRQSWPELPVIVCSTLTRAGASTVIEALFRGANDCIAKPSTSGAGDPQDQLRRELVPRIRGLLGRSRRGSGRANPAPQVPRRRPPGGVEIVVVGASTGGPSALREVLIALPEDLHVPVVVVQHMPTQFTRMMSERLNERCAVEVQEAHDGAVVQPGQVWIAPGGFHMVVAPRPGAAVLHLNQDPPVQSCRPAVDVLLRSVTERFGGAALAVILTGMGRDGADGCAELRQAGGQIIVQDEASSVVWGMPGAVARAGLHDAICPLDQVAGEILRRSGYHRQRLLDRGLSAERAPGRAAICHQR